MTTHDKTGIVILIGLAGIALMVSFSWKLTLGYFLYKLSEAGCKVLDKENKPASPHPPHGDITSADS